MLIKLPNIIKIFLLSLLFSGFFVFSAPVHAQPVPTTPPDATTGWVKDQEVTFVGKTATRANNFLDWTLQDKNYKWIVLLIKREIGANHG
jgi:hypothetical protein